MSSSVRAADKMAETLAVPIVNRSQLGPNNVFSKHGRIIAFSCNMSTGCFTSSVQSSLRLYLLRPRQTQWEHSLSPNYFPTRAKGTDDHWLLTLHKLMNLYRFSIAEVVKLELVYDSCVSDFKGVLFKQELIIIQTLWFLQLVWRDQLGLSIGNRSLGL